MNMLEIIEKKKTGRELNKEEIAFFSNGAAEHTIPDYQISALLMAIRLMGMNHRETADLTLAMRDSGDIADLSSIPGVKVDKHSTGGVADTTTLVLAPLVAACGVPVAKMSGRGLGHTGGTLDKLESIPGMRVSLSETDFIRQVRDIGVAVIGQTGRLAPADKTLYGIRDVTGSVDSLPLIASSILSKKLAAGSDAIVLDVKSGSGALMHTPYDSIELAITMVRVGEVAGKPVVALVSSMDQPLGTHVGNALEVKEAIDILSGRAGGDLLDVSLMLGSYMLVLGGKALSEDDAKEQLKAAVASGAGLEKFRQMIEAQGGDPRVCDNVSRLPQAGVVRTVTCGESGWVQSMDTTALGLAAQAMGAGRMRLDDEINYAAGYVLHVRIGDRVEPDTPLCELHARSEAVVEQAERAIRAAITIGQEPCEKNSVFKAVVTKHGITYLDTNPMHTLL